MANVVRKTKIEMITIVLITLLCVCGCNKAAREPKIEIEGHDTTEWSEISISYHNHRHNNNGVPHVTLGSPEELEQYKEQISFLLKQLEEAERKMKIHEPSITD